MRDGRQSDAMLVVADLNDKAGKRYREPTGAERDASAAASEALASEPLFGPGLSAVPDEQIESNHPTLRPVGYGYRSWGELCNDRQTLGFVRLAASSTRSAANCRPPGSAATTPQR